MANCASRFKSLSIKKFRTEGFSLLEIVIAIALISIMSVPIMGSYIKTQQRARDSVRKHNISEISNALEEYYGICGFAYPAAGAYTGILSGTNRLIPVFFQVRFA